jgi:hypothetical protein
LWLPKNDLRDSSSWSSHPLVLLRDIHATLISQYDRDYKEVCVTSQSQGNVGASARPSSQDGVPQQQQDAPLSLTRLDRLFEASFVRDESSVSNTDVVALPSQLNLRLLNRSCFIGSPSGTLSLSTRDHVRRNS